MTRVLLSIGVLAPLSFAQVAWVTMQPTTSPPARYQHAMAYDAARGVTVMFGGLTGATVFGDTWTYDGSTWTQQAVSGPSPRYGHSMAYDAQRQVVVLFGGALQWPNGESNETWEWNGATWTLRTPAVSPPPRHGHASAPFPPLGGIVVLGGASAGTVAPTPPHFWRWDGTTWLDLTTANTPYDFGHSLAYHAGQQRLVMHGRSASANTFSTADGIDWLPSDASVWGRNEGGLAYDSVRDRIVAFGGYYGSDYTHPIGQTWVWDGVWCDLQTASNSYSRSDFAMAFDAARGRVVVHGGHYVSWGSSSVFGDTLELADVTLPAPYVEPAVTAFALTSECQHIGVPPLFSITSKPVLHSNGEFAWVGENFPLVCRNLGGPFTPAPVALVYGTSNQSWGGVSLPLPLTVLGRPDCLLAVEPQLTMVFSATGQLYHLLSIPNVPSLVGTEHFFQVMGGSPVGDWFTSNGLGIRLGDR
jgi:hypothetical protein